jgi:hypothetical protein
MSSHVVKALLQEPQHDDWPGSSATTMLKNRDPYDPTIHPRPVAVHKSCVWVGQGIPEDQREDLVVLEDRLVIDSFPG